MKRIRPPSEVLAEWLRTDKRLSREHRKQLRSIIVLSKKEEKAMSTNQNDISDNASHERCSKCGGEKDSEGWCANYCMDEGPLVPCWNECEACGDDHEIHECPAGFCGQCYEILDNCDCDEPHEITAEEWLKEKTKIDAGYRADMEALKAESRALQQDHAHQEMLYAHAEMVEEKRDPMLAYPFKSDLDLHNADVAAITDALETVDVQVELLAFPIEVKERTVRVPKSEWDLATDEQKLDLVFQYGQNDFQPSRTCYSVSVNDVIRMPNGERFRISPCGFERMS